VQTDANSAADLFTALQDEDCVVFAHIGDRYADIKVAHDARIERSVELHSDWGTFEWLLEDAFEQGYRVGVLANSDGHKGRHGASHPGASLFGAYGGLPCSTPCATGTITRPPAPGSIWRPTYVSTPRPRCIAMTPAWGAASVRRCERP